MSEGAALADFLRATEVIDHDHPAVRERALALAGTRPAQTARCSFEWVRDRIRHSVDFGLDDVACSASEALIAEAGLCFAKSHLLAALLRANRIPAGLVYQRVRFREAFVLHGLVAVRLPGIGWYRCDPRGNKPGVDAQFVPPDERLAFTPGLDIIDVPGIFPNPLPEVVRVLRPTRTLDEVLNELPDLPKGATGKFPE
jgi:transglutaminase-like putative cysteine protease